jgi:KTSC domain
MSPDCQSSFVMNAVNSSVLAQMGYDAPRAVLQVMFHAGGIYQYFGVPQNTYWDLLRAESIGGYFNRHIRNAFPCARQRDSTLSPSPH